MKNRSKRIKIDQGQTPKGGRKRGEIKKTVKDVKDGYRAFVKAVHCCIFHSIVLIYRVIIVCEGAKDS